MKNIGQLLFGLIVSLQVFTSTAQVFDSNGNGYVNVTLVPGFNLVANPLNAPDNSIGALFKNMQGGIPDGTTVYKLINGAFITASYIELTGSFEPADAAAETTGPGEGVFVFLGGSANKVLTFVGQIPQSQICTPLPHGFSIKSNLIPVSQTLDQMRLPISPDGDVVYTYNSVGRNYSATSYIPFLAAWDSGSSIKIGQAFCLYRTGPNTTWCDPPAVEPQPVHEFAIPSAD